MNLIIKFLTILILLIIPISCQVTFNPKSIKNDKLSITFEWDINDTNYYTKWMIQKIDKSNSYKNMSFICNDSTGSRICIFTTDETNIKTLYGNSITTCYNIGNGNEKCEGLLKNEHLPTPIITTPTSFNPKVDGEIILIKGYFLKMINDPTYIATLSATNGGIVDVVSDVLSPTFDPTNLNISIPKGCGSSSLNWLNGRGTPLEFNFKSATIDGPNSKLSLDGLSVELVGINFCNSSNSMIEIHVGDDLIPQSSINIVNSTFISFDPNQVYSSKNKSITISGSTNSINLNFEPVPQKVNSVPIDGGLIKINGTRLQSANPNAATTQIKIGESYCTVEEQTPTFVSCSIAQSYAGTFDLILDVDGLKNKVKFYFTFNQPELFPFTKDMQKGNMFHLYGQCLGTNATSKLTINNQQITILSFAQDQSSMTFSLSGNYSGNLSATLVVGLEGNSKLSTDFEFVPLLYVTPDYSSGDIPSNSSRFKFYFSTQNVNSPTIKIYDQLFDASDTGTLNSDDFSTSFTFSNFPPVCNPTAFTAQIGEQSYNDNIAAPPPIIDSCKLNGTLTTCFGKNFGGNSFSDQISIFFSNQTFTPVYSTDTNFTFETLDTFYTDNLTISTCSNHYNFGYSLTPVYLFTNATDLDVDGGNVYIRGKYFSKNTAPTITCPNVSEKCDYQNATTLLCLLKDKVKGPYDIDCYLTINEKNESFVTTFHGPVPLSATSVSIEGGTVFIYGKYLYEIIDSITIGNVSCENPQYQSFSFNQKLTGEKMTPSYYTCNLPPQSDESLYNITLLPISLSINNKIGTNYIFSYMRHFQPLISKNDNSIHPMVFICSIIILIGLLSIFLRFILNRCNGKIKKRTKLDSKMIEKQLQEPLRRQMTEAQLMPESRSSTMYPNY